MQIKQAIVKKLQNNIYPNMLDYITHHHRHHQRQVEEMLKQNLCTGVDLQIVVVGKDSIKDMLLITIKEIFIGLVVTVGLLLHK